jgi:hypothetical protein
MYKDTIEGNIFFYTIIENSNENGEAFIYKLL